MPRPGKKKIVVGKMLIYSKYLSKKGRRRQELMLRMRRTKSKKVRSAVVTELEENHGCKFIDLADYEPQQRCKNPNYVGR